MYHYVLCVINLLVLKFKTCACEHASVDSSNTEHYMKTFSKTLFLTDLMGRFLFCMLFYSR